MRSTSKSVGPKIEVDALNSGFVKMKVDTHKF